MSQHTMASFAMFGLLLAVNHVVPTGAVNMESRHSTHNGQASSSVADKEVVKRWGEHLKRGFGTLTRRETVGQASPLEVVPSEHLMRREAGGEDAQVSLSAQGAVHMLGQQPDLANHSSSAVHESIVPQMAEMAMQGVEAAKFHTEYVRHTQVHASVEPTVKAHDKPWPIWAQVMLGSLTTLIIMSSFFLIKQRMQALVTPGLDGERLKIVLAETVARMEVLQAQLDNHYRDSDPLLSEDGQDEAVTEARSRAQDISQRAELRSQEIRDHAGRMAEQKDQLIESASRAQSAFTDALETGRDHLQEFSTKEATDLVAKVQGAMDAGNIPAYEVPGWMAQSDQEELLSLPPLFTLIQGVFAAKQIRWLKDGSSMVITLDTVMMILSAVTFGLDWTKKCTDIQVWIWHIGFLSITSSDFFVRTLIVRWSGTALNVLKETRNEREKATKDMTGIPLLDMMIALQSGSEGYFEPYFKYHEVAASWTAGLMQFLVFINLCWGAFGLWVSIEDIVIDSLGCDAKTALIFMHVYSLFYVLFLTWNLLFVLKWAGGYVASSNMLSTTILKQAKSFDDDTMKGIPLAMTLVESFVLKNSASAISMSKREVQQDVEQLNQQLQDMDVQLLALQRSKTKTDEVLAAEKTQEEHLEHYSEILHDALEQAKPLVGLLAANIRTEDVVDAGQRTVETAASPEQAPKAKPKRKPLRRTPGSAEDVTSEEDPTEAAGHDVEGF